MSDEESPLDAIRTRADEMGLEGEERDDYILGRMQRAGYKKGPGEWIREEDDDEPHEDDDQPMTRADWRRIQREQRQKTASMTPPKKNNDDDEPPTKARKPRNESSKPNANAWWK